MVSSNGSTKGFIMGMLVIAIIFIFSCVMGRIPIHRLVDF